MNIQKEIEIDGLPLSYHRIALMEVDVLLGVVNLTIRSWFNKAAADSGTPPHRVHAMTSIGDNTQLAQVLQTALLASPLADGMLIMEQPATE